MVPPNGLAASLLALGGVVSAIQLHQPRATPINKNYHENGWTPKPTTKPKPLMELFRRQADPEFCGYLEGDGEYPITCDIGSSCMYDDVFSWFGCCTGTSITDCDVYTACVRSNAIDECLDSSECAYDPLAMACTSEDLPFCATLYTSISGFAYGHFVCAESSTSLEVLSTSNDNDLDPSSIFLSDLETVTRSSSAARSKSTSTEEEDETNSETATGTRPRTSAADSSPTPAQERSSQGAEGAPPTSSTPAAAMRTAEAVVGVMGGVVGMLALLL